METFLQKLDSRKTCLLGSSSTVQLVPVPSLTHHSAEIIAVHTEIKEAF